MTEYDVAELLISYAGKCTKAITKKQLQDIIRELKKRLDSREICRMCISEENTFILAKAAK